MSYKNQTTRTIALRFADNFAPEPGTILIHSNLIKENGYVWYGKLGNPISQRVIEDLLSQKSPRILLIHSGRADRYWAKVEYIQREQPCLDEIPFYYRAQAKKFRTWFKLTNIEAAEPDVMLKCKVASSGDMLSNVSKHSLSPYFIIDYSGTLL